MWCFFCVFVLLFAVAVVGVDMCLLCCLRRVFMSCVAACVRLCARAFRFCLSVAVSLISVRPLCFAARPRVSCACTCLFVVVADCNLCPCLCSLCACVVSLCVLLLCVLAVAAVAAVAVVDVVVCCVCACFVASI